LRDLKAAGCEKFFTEQVSTLAERQQLAAALDLIGDGDVLVAVSLDRLVRSTRHLAQITDDLDGIPKGQALMLIRTRVGCSEEIMDNIAPNCRVWLDGGIHDMAMSSDYGNEEDCS